MHDEGDVIRYHLALLGKKAFGFNTPGHTIRVTRNAQEDTKTHSAQAVLPNGDDVGV